jgi:hypothetical protein
MSLKRIARLVASAGVTAGLAFGGLATVGTTSADAAVSSTTVMYDCNSPLGVFHVPATLSLDTLDDALQANLPTGALPVNIALDFSAAGLVPSLLFTLQSTLDSVLYPAGLGAVAVQLDGVFTQLGAQAATISGQLSSFIPTGTGSLPIPVPTSLDFGQLVPGLSALGISCTLNKAYQGATIGTYTVVKQGAKVKAKTKHMLHKGKKAVVKVSVKTSGGQAGVGQVVAKVKGQKAKVKTLVGGKAKLVFKKLKIGKQKIKVSYLGNGYTNPAKKKVHVRVVR